MTWSGPPPPPPPPPRGPNGQDGRPSWRHPSMAARPRRPAGPLLIRHQVASRRRRQTAGRRRRTVHALLSIAAIVLGIGGAAAATGYSGYNGYLSQLPEPTRLNGMEPPEDTHVYALDGTLLATFHDQSFRHVHVNLRDVALIAQRATIDIEDRKFYEHSSWDLPRIIKAGYDNITHSGPIQGASTITEQLAKISFFPNSDRTVDRKIKQLILGNQIEADYTKDQILEMYLNRIPYGNHAIGIETAAQMYFHVASRDLDLAQASLLAGLPESPSAFDPLDHDPGAAINPAAKARQRTVLDAMVTVGDISEPDAARAFLEPLTLHSWEEGEGIQAPDFVQYVRDYVEKRWGEAFLRPGGWEILTSLERSKQAAAEQAVHDGVAAVSDRFNAHDGALVSINPKTGSVQALVGAWNDRDPGVGQLNMALRPVQPGSTIKVFTYSAAIASRQFTMTTPVVDAPVALVGGDGRPYSPLNYDRKWHGVCPLKMCLGNSLNVPAVKVEAATGIPQITDLEIAAGLTSLADPRNRPGPKDYAATLGGLSVGISPLDLASGAATLANLGIYRPPAPVLKISDRAGHNLYLHDPQAGSHRAIPEDVAYIIDQITSNDANRVMEFGPHGDLTLPGRRVSAKTGTTEYFVANWTVGWVPDSASAVWVGNPQPSCLRPQDRGAMAARLQRGAASPDHSLDYPFSPADLAHYGLTPLNDHCGHLEGATGITGAAPIWNHYMRLALEGLAPGWYARPADVQARGPGVGDDADFYLPGTAPAAQPGCIPAGPPTDPTSVCRPAPRPEPQPLPQLPGLPVLPGNNGNPGFGNGGLIIPPAFLP